MQRLTPPVASQARLLDSKSTRRCRLTRSHLAVCYVTRIHLIGQDRLVSNPVKGEHLTTRDACLRIEKPSRCFRSVTTLVCARYLGGFRTPPAHPFAAPPSPPVSVPRAIPLSKSGENVLTRSCSRGLPCDAPRLTIKDASDRLLPPNTQSTSTRTRLLPDSSSGLAPCVHAMGCAHRDRGIERFTTPEALRRIARFRGEYSSRHEAPHFKVRRPTSDTPVADLTRTEHDVL